MAEIWNAEDQRYALDAVKTFEATYGTKFPRAVAKITDDIDQLLAFYDFPAQRWVQLRTTSPIESILLRYATAARSPRGREAAAYELACTAAAA